MRRHSGYLGPSTSTCWNMLPSILHKCRHFTSRITPPWAVIHISLPSQKDMSNCIETADVRRTHGTSITVSSRKKSWSAQIELNCAGMNWGQRTVVPADVTCTKTRSQSLSRISRNGSRGKMGRFAIPVDRRNTSGIIRVHVDIRGITDPSNA